MADSDDELAAALLALIIAASSIGVGAGSDQLDTAALAVDNAAAMSAADEQSAIIAERALQQINDTTRRGLMAAITAAVTAGLTMEQFRESIDRYFNRDRAGNISQTETTDGFAVGVAAAATLAEVTLMEWYTLRDERVCPICLPMDGKRRQVGGAYDAGLPVQDSPPAHPRCRCGETMVLRSIGR